MSVTGQVKEGQSNFTKYVGFFKGKVVAVNPTREKLNKLLGNDNDADEINYTGEKNGINTATLTFWLEAEGHEGVYIPYKIYIKNEPFVSKKNGVTKIQLINSTGDTQWVEVDDNWELGDEFDTTSLWDSFKFFTNVIQWISPDGETHEKWRKGAKPNEVEILGEKTVRPALIGEEELLNFMKWWLCYGNKGLNLRHPQTNLLLDTKKWFLGNFKELNLIDQPFTSPFTALAYVRVDKNNPDKQYQQVFKKFLPSFFMQLISKGLNLTKDYEKEQWKKFTEEVEGEHGISDCLYVYEPLREYDSEEDINAAKTTKVQINEPNVTSTNSKY